MAPRTRTASLIVAVACLSQALGTGTWSRTAFAQTAKAAPDARSAPQDLVAKGQALFDDQQYEESIQTLSAALLKPTSTKAQKIEIHRLLALNYITLGRKDEAESAVRGLLVIDPEVRLPATESPRFRDFFAQVRAKWEAEGRPGLAPETTPEKPVTLKHASPSQVEPDHGVDLRARLDDPTARVTAVTLFYRAGSRGDFVEAPATVDGASVRARIPASAVKPPLVEYYLVGTDAKGAVVTSRGDVGSPLRIAVPEASRGWVLPVAIGGGILGAAAIVGGLALAGVFKGSSSSGPAASGMSTVNVSVSEASR